LVGVDILTPDFAALARSCHVAHHLVRNIDSLRELLGQLDGSHEPVMIELDAAAFLVT